MSLNKSMRSECLKVGSEAKNKKEVLQEIASLAKKSSVLKKISEKDIYNALKEREALGSTGFEDGVAIPHCGIEGIDEFVLGVLTIPQGVNFKALDGNPSSLFIFIIGPLKARNKHIKLLSGISKIIQEKSDIEEFLVATNSEMLFDLVNKKIPQDENDEDVTVEHKFCQFMVYVQKEEYFSDILETLSSEVDGTISVIETNNAGFYLNRIPLFASYWTDNSLGFNRILIAVVDKNFMNNVIRRIHAIVPKLDDESGVMITVQDLVYSVGSIDF